MVDVESLSDAELRTKLMEYGYPIMPITGTTRKLMMKKLKILMENKNDGRRSLGRYSSEEESDSDAKATKKDKNRRITMAAPRSIRNNREKDLIERTPKDVVKTTKRTTTSTKLIKSLQDEFDTGSDSDPEIIENNFESSTTFSPSSQMNFQHAKSKYTRPQTVTSSSNFSSSYSQSSTNADKPLSSSRYTAPPSDDSDVGLDRLTQIRSRLSLGNTSFERNRPMYASTPEEKADTPFLSNFTRRLSQLSNVPKTDYDYKNDVIKEHDTNGAGGYARNFLARQQAARPRDVNYDYYPRNGGRKNLIPLLLVVVACLFFVVVGVMYYGMRSENAAIQSAGYFIPRCTDPDAKPGFNCIQDVDIEDAVNLMVYIKPELVKRAVSYACKDAVVKPFLTESEVINLQHLNSDAVDVIEIRKQLANMEVLAFKNVEWGISMVKTDAGYDLSDDHVLDDMEALTTYKKSKSVGLAVLHPDLPLRCRFYNKLYVVFNSAVVISATFFVLYCLNLAYKHVKNYNKQRKDEVYNIVRRIIDTLETNSNEGGNDDFLVINHVRDMILPINDRKQMERVWNEAVKFLNEHESRVRTEVQVIQGEPYDVWRWLSNPNTSGNVRSKTWQGQAFETQIGSVNSLPCSPTPCLKVRGMMDDNDPNLVSIREAILSKCAHQCRILHCIVDNTSKCVYLKCADQNDAAVAYRSLHGWWYSGHLVTVKYLRLERYMQRFPDSPLSGPPFLKSLTPATDWSS